MSAPPQRRTGSTSVRRSPPPMGCARPARALKTRDEARRRVEELRQQSALVDAALEAGDLDRRRAGSLLAGGIAFRIFLWLLPAALFAAAVVGLVRPTGGGPPPPGRPCPRPPARGAG